MTPSRRWKVPHRALEGREVDEERALEAHLLSLLEKGCAVHDQRRAARQRGQGQQPAGVLHGPTATSVT